MVNESILGGLRTAISHKSTLKDAMQSFYNAGYNKQEIEEAAKIIFQEQKQAVIPKEPEIKKEETKKTKPDKKTQEEKPPVKKPSLKKTIIIILLILFVLILIGGLTAVILFKDKIF